VKPCFSLFKGQHQQAGLMLSMTAVAQKEETSDSTIPSTELACSPRPTPRVAGYIHCCEGASSAGVSPGQPVNSSLGQGDVAHHAEPIRHGVP